MILLKRIILSIISCISFFLILSSSLMGLIDYVLMYFVSFFLTYYLMLLFIIKNEKEKYLDKNILVSSLFLMFILILYFFNFWIPAISSQPINQFYFFKIALFLLSLKELIVSFIFYKDKYKQILIYNLIYNLIFLIVGGINLFLLTFVYILFI